MKIAMIGTGYVGLVTGTCLADSGNDVTCVDIDQAKIERLEHGEIPIYEPGLSELVVRNASAGRLKFTTKTADAVRTAKLVFIAVGTPTSERPEDKGAADLKYVWKAVEGFAPHLAHDAIVVVKSTVPVGTNTKLFNRLRELTGRECDVASNPEFLKEGAAVNDFQYPDRVVVGVRTPHAEETLQGAVCPVPAHRQAVPGDDARKRRADEVRRQCPAFDEDQLHQRNGQSVRAAGRRHQRRPPRHRSRPADRLCSSCFRASVTAAAAFPRTCGPWPTWPARPASTRRCSTRSMKSITARSTCCGRKFNEHFGGKLAGKHFALWGLAFKPKTDDIREAPALTLIDHLLAAGAKVAVHDPEAMENVRADYGDKLIYGHTPMDVLEGADALAINTEWGEFRNPDFDEMRRRMAGPIVFDGRNLYEPAHMRDHGFIYYSIGRVAVKP